MAPPAAPDLAAPDATATVPAAPTPAAKLESADIIAPTAPTDAVEPPQAIPIKPLRLRRSYFATGVESLGILAGLNIGGRLLNYSYVNVSVDSLAKNLSSRWVWDDDLFATNQFGHPYMGSLFYSSARANGLSVLGSAAVTYVDSLIWELAFETEIPSINDQLLTPVAGVLLGEVLHRWSRSILWRPNGQRPGVLRQVMAGVLNPIGLITRHTFGEAWRIDPPPPSFGWLSLGWAGLATAFDTPSGTTVTRSRLVFGGLAYIYGLPTSARYQPRRPLDHFDARFEGNASRTQSYATLRLRGLLYGTSFGHRHLRGIWGAFGGYDFDNPERLRVSTLTLGVGATIHVPIRNRMFFQGTAIASIIPYGTAGSGLPDNGTNRDYHRGPGAAQLLEAKIGYRGVGIVRAAISSYEINGSAFNEGGEAIVLSRLGLMAAITDRHAVGVEAGFGYRHATFEAADSVTDRSASLRFYYALIQDSDFGGGP
ncbi:MAG: DUF3943 domain-containing protein [Kofleriaceae bacterium]|nr:DUF3943 domain-containing protein [Kofleriaceae bacterium]